LVQRTVGSLTKNVVFFDNLRFFPSLALAPLVHSATKIEDFCMPVLLKKKTLFFFFGALLALQNPKGFVLTKIFDFCIATKIFDFCNGACKPKVFEKRMRSEFPAGFEPFHIFDNVKNVRYIFSFVKYVNFCF